MITNNLSLLTVSFNSNILTCMMIKSFMKQSGLYIPTVVVDNGTTEPVDNLLKKSFTVVDNFSHKLIIDERQNSRNHCAAIDYAIYNHIKTDWCLLVDNDILFLPTLKIILALANRSQYDVYGEIGYDMTPPNRIYPYFCLINVKRMKAEGIRYYDRNRITSYYMRDNMGRNINTDQKYNVMDTGYSFYADITANHWNIMNFPLPFVCKHYKEGSAAGLAILQWLEQNHDLF